MELFGDPKTYHAIAEQILDTGAALDAGMLYFDARLAVDYPTVEVRVADVCTEVEDAVLVAALVRALVETAAREWRRGECPADWRTDELRIAGWRAAKCGVTDRLVHPLDHRVAAVAEVLTSVADHAATPWTSRATPTSSAAASSGSSPPATGPTASVRRSKREATSSRSSMTFADERRRPGHDRVAGRR